MRAVGSSAPPLEPLSSSGTICGIRIPSTIGVCGELRNGTTPLLPVPEVRKPHRRARRTRRGPVNSPGSRGEERQQLEWFTHGAALAALLDASFIATTFAFGYRSRCRCSSPCCATGCTTSTGSSTAPWSMAPHIRPGDGLRRSGANPIAGVRRAGQGPGTDPMPVVPRTSVGDLRTIANSLGEHVRERHSLRQPPHREAQEEE
jgi:hypothetical protein